MAPPPLVGALPQRCGSIALAIALSMPWHGATIDIAKFMPHNPGEAGGPFRQDGEGDGASTLRPHLRFLAVWGGGHSII